MYIIYQGRTVGDSTFKKWLLYANHDQEMLKKLEFSLSRISTTRSPTKSFTCLCMSNLLSIIILQNTRNIIIILTWMCYYVNLMPPCRVWTLTISLIEWARLDSFLYIITISCLSSHSVNLQSQALLELKVIPFSDCQILGICFKINLNILSSVVAHKTQVINSNNVHILFLF